MPRLDGDATARIEAALYRYLKLSTAAARAAALDRSVGAAARRALLTVDAAVLRAYDLPPRLEARLLDQMSGLHAGRPVPEGFKDYPRRARAAALPLWLCLSLGRFYNLVDRQLAGALTEPEAAELAELDARLTDAKAGADGERADWLRTAAEEREAEGEALAALRAEAAALAAEGDEG